MNTISPSLPIQFINSIGSQSRGQPQVSIQPQVGQLLNAQVIETQPDNRFLLQIGESKITAQSDQPLKVGQTLQLQVTSASPQVELRIVSDTLSPFLGRSLTFIGKNLDISSLFSSLQHASAAGVKQSGTQPQQAAAPSAAVSSPQLATPQLEGTTFKAEVTGRLSNTSYTLQAGSSKITVDSPVPLRAGQSFELQVTSASPEVQVKIAGEASPQLLGHSLTIVEKPADVAVLLLASQQKSTIFEILSPLTRQTLESFQTLQQGQTTGKNNGENLKQLVDRLGLSFENQLARGETSKAASSLKAALMEVLANMRGSEQITKNASQLLSTLELFQLAQLQTDTGQQFIFPLPLPFLEQGYLLVDKNDGEGQDGAGDNDERRFSLHLRMTDIGNIRVDFFQSNDGLLIRFHTDSKEKSEFIKENSKELREALADVPLLGLTFGTEADDPASELLRHIIPEGRSVLDTKV